MADLEEHDEGLKIIDIEEYELPAVPLVADTISDIGDSDTRLIIYSIELENFKSYGGKHILGPFHDRFSCIIGPNGSGKSNIIDSMLFVFGYRAQRIRGSNLISLIHTSPEIPKPAYCSVSINFKLIRNYDHLKSQQTENPYEVVDGFVISRCAFASGGSVYRINNKDSRFTHVQEKLKFYGVDLVNNRFLILQGEVEQIASMKPKKETDGTIGLVEYLESIIGTDRYIEPITLAQSRYDQLDNDRLEFSNRVRMADAECKTHEKPYRAAIEYMRKENELNSLTKKSYEHELGHENDELAGERAKLAQIETAFVSIRNRIQAMKLDYKQKQETVERLKSQSSKEKKRLDEFKSQYLKLSSAKSQRESEIDHNRRAIEDLGKKLKKEIKNLDKFTAQIEETEREFERGTCQSELDQFLCECKSRLEEAKTLAEPQIKEILDKLALEEARMMEHQPLYAELEQKIEIAFDVRKEVHREYEEVKEKYAICEGALKTAKMTTLQLGRDIIDCQDELSRDSNQLSKLAVAIDKAKAVAKKQREHLLRMDNDLNSLKRARETNVSRNAVLEFLKFQHSEGNVSGFRGRLGDLAYVQPKYDIAVSTAGGGYLDYIVTNTIRDANLCIELLKKHKAGRATVIALDQQKSKWERVIARKFDCPMPEAGVERIIDILNLSDEDLRPVFYHVFRDTLVCPHLNIADKVALRGSKRHRTVTYGGHLFETSGTVSGGGKPKQGKISTSERRMVIPPSNQEINSLESKIERHRVDIEKVRLEIEQLEGEAGCLTSKVKKFDQSLAEAKLNLQNELKNRTRLKRDFQALDLKMAELDKACAISDEKKHEIGKLQYDYETIGSLYKAAKHSVDTLRAEIDARTDEIVGQARIEFEKAEKAAADERKRLDKLKIALQVSGKQKESLEKRIAEGKESEIRLREANERLMLEFDDFEEKRVALDEKHKSVEELCKNLSSEIKAMVEECSKIMDSISACETEDVKVSEEKKLVEMAVHDRELAIRRICEQLKTLTFHELGGDGEDDEVGGEIEVEFDDDINKRIAKLTSELKAKTPNLSIVQLYRQKMALFRQRKAEADDLNERIERVLVKLHELTNRRYNEFSDSLNIISENLRAIFQRLTMGGDAELEMVDSADPFSEGIDFSVRPQKKSWKKISNISGGEKTLSSLALIFALHIYKRTPLYFMDEIDAALDFRNVTIIRNYVKQCTRNAQFVVVSLRQQMFHGADRVTGISKRNGISASVTCMNDVLMRRRRMLLAGIQTTKRKLENSDPHHGGGDDDDAKAPKQLALIKLPTTPDPMEAI